MISNSKMRGPYRKGMILSTRRSEDALNPRSKGRAPSRYSGRSSLIAKALAFQGAASGDKRADQRGGNPE